jgi:hypothetical protein
MDFMWVNQELLAIGLFKYWAHGVTWTLEKEKWQDSDIGHGTGVILFPWDWRGCIFRRRENMMGNRSPADGDFWEQIHKIYKFTNLQKLHEGVCPHISGDTVMQVVRRVRQWHICQYIASRGVLQT